MVQKSNQVAVTASEPHEVTGYRAFKLGQFEFSRDSYFATGVAPVNQDTQTPLS
ncbi:hydroquinone dioxygenase large subunit (plasmid) [Burkholderia sp. YI23]|nr:hydroquinone dioxygenase large subunit [Burkholderia sp. YI23]